MKPILFVFSLVFSVTLVGQNFLTKDELDNRSIKFFEQAKRHVSVQNWQEAILCLDKLLERQPNAIDALLFRAGINYDVGNFAPAVTDYKSALELSETYSTLMYYQLAMSEYRSEKYKDAVEHFETFLSLEEIENRYRNRASTYLEKARVADRLKNNPVPFKPQSLGPNINTKGKEYLPSFTADGQLLVYTVNYDGQEDFYFSRKDENGNWIKGQAFEEVNTRANEGAQSISVDGRTFFFTGCEREGGLGSCDLYYTEWKNGGWAKIIHPEPPLNSRYWESQPCLSSNGKWLFFASDRPGGFGGNDIWVCPREENGDWGKPINLGSPINTKGNDAAPFIHPDGQTLYFMSDGHPGLGGYDLFLSRLENGEYQPPQNLGYPINTAASEGALVVSLDGETAYFTTNTATNKGEKQNFDIYSFLLHTDARPKPVTYVSGRVNDEETGKSLAGVTVKVKDEKDAQLNSEVQTDKEGRFLIVLPAGKNYQFIAEEDGYLFFSERFELKKNNEFYNPFELNINLQAIATETEEREEIVLRNVLFNSNSDQLLESSSEELRQLVRLLKENPAINIQINGHTDNVGTPDNNLLLSQKRAEAVKTFLAEATISSSRLKTKGFGESQPIADNQTENGRTLNRRTAFVVLKD